jgi:hypothetical protein
MTTTLYNFLDINRNINVYFIQNDCVYRHKRNYVFSSYTYAVGKPTGEWLCARVCKSCGQCESSKDERAPAAIDERWYYYYYEVPIETGMTGSRRRIIISSCAVVNSTWNNVVVVVDLQWWLVPYLPAPCEFDYRPVIIIIVEKDAGTNQTDAVRHYNNIITLNYRYYCYYYYYRVVFIRYCGGQVGYSAVGQPRFSHTPVIRFSRVSCAHVLYCSYRSSSVIIIIIIIIIIQCRDRVSHTRCRDCFLAAEVFPSSSTGSRSHTHSRSHRLLLRDRVYPFCGFIF